MNPTPPQLDLVSVLVILATAIFSPSVAAVLAPQIVILIGATLGAAWGASRRPPTSRFGSARYVVGMVLLALMVTVPAAEVLSGWIQALPLHWLLGPVAALIGAMEPEWLMNKARRLLGRRLGDDDEN
jgi:uncharacterized membrane protein